MINSDNLNRILMLEDIMQGEQYLLCTRTGPSLVDREISSFAGSKLPARPKSQKESSSFDCRRRAIVACEVCCIYHTVHLHIEALDSNFKCCGQNW